MAPYTSAPIVTAIIDPAPAVTPWASAGVRCSVRGVAGPNLDVLLLDNKDSFTWNIAHAYAELGAVVDVVDADLVTADQVVAARAAGLGPKLVVVGPGPRGPRDLPRLVELVSALDGEVPLFGICLGLQALVMARGGTVGRARAPLHGKRDRVDVDGAGCFAGLPKALWVMRYHSLVATALPQSLVATAHDVFGQVMAVRDARARVEAVQFHPESIGTAGGMTLLENTLRAVGADVDVDADSARVRSVRAGAVPAAHDHGPSFSWRATG